jgi:hypothetical protein
MGRGEADEGRGPGGSRGSAAAAAADLPLAGQQPVVALDQRQQPAALVQPVLLALGVQGGQPPQGGDVPGQLLGAAPGFGLRRLGQQGQRGQGQGQGQGRLGLGQVLQAAVFAGQGVADLGWGRRVGLLNLG